MTFEKVMRVAVMYRDEIFACRSEPFADWERHIIQMATEMESWGPERKEKAMRWLGFIQGVLWMAGYYEIEELKRHNQTGEVK